MTKTDWSVLALNLAALIWAIMGLTAQHLDPLSVAALLAVASAIVNGGWVVWRRRDREAAPVEQAVRASDELSANEILDLDARLEALEQAQADAADAARWRALVESGQVTGPAADAPGALDRSTAAALRNGR